MLRDRDIGSWEVFVIVAETGSISKASERLQMDPARISRTVNALEEDLGGVKLFDRSIRPLRLTENGEIALTGAREILRAHRSLKDAINTDRNAMTGTIRVAFPPAMLQTYLLPFLTDFMREYPEIYLDVSEYKGSAPVNFDTPRGRLDIIAGYGEDLSHPNIVQIPYGNAPFVACASPIYADRHGLPEHPRDLTCHTGILLNYPMRPAIRHLQKDGESWFLRWGKEISFDSAISAKNAAVFGVGIHPGIPTLHCFRELESRQLVPALPGWESPSAKLFIYVRPESMRLKKIHTFIDAYKAFIDRLHRKCEKVLEPIVGQIRMTL